MPERLASRAAKLMLVPALTAAFEVLDGLESVDVAEAVSVAVWSAVVVAVVWAATDDGMVVEATGTPVAAAVLPIMEVLPPLGPYTVAMESVLAELPDTLIGVAPELSDIVLELS